MDLIKKLNVNVLTSKLDVQYNELRDKLREYNQSKIGAHQTDPVLFEYRDNDQLIAGAYAKKSLGAVYLDILWVDKAYRKQKLGSLLLNHLDDFAKNKKALYIWTRSATFQAVDFYLNHGYEVFAKLPLKNNDQKNMFDYFLIKYM